jgi:predicted transcriptional regulator
LETKLGDLADRFNQGLIDRTQINRQAEALQRGQTELQADLNEFKTRTQNQILAVQGRENDELVERLG